MSGLFARLVREATGQPRNPVQGGMPVRFQQDPEMAPSVPIYTQSEDVPVSSASSPEAITESVPPLVTPGPSDTRATTSPLDNAVRSPLQENFELTGGESVEARLLVSESAREPPATQRARDRGATANEPVATSADVVTLAVMGSPGQYEYQQAGDSQTVAKVSARDKSQAKTLVEPGAPEPGTPAPLLPALATAAPADPQNASQPPANAVDSPAEVHVHIGRIEVTALASTAPPKPKPRSTRQPMSLDDYLVRRGPGRS